MSNDRYGRLNDYVMGFIYSPLLLITAWFETREAYHIKNNRRIGESDEDTTEEWEQMMGEVDFESEGWSKKVESTKPNVEFGAAELEVRNLKDKVEELKKMIEDMSKRTEGKSNGDT